MRHGAISAVIVAERAETVAAMRRAEAQVRSGLAEQGLDVAQFDVRQGMGQDTQGPAARQPASPAGGRRMMAFGQEPEPAAVAYRWRRARHLDLVA